MQFVDVENPFGARAFDPAAFDPIKDAPRTKRLVGGRKAAFMSRPSILPIATNYQTVTD